MIDCGSRTLTSEPLKNSSVTWKNFNKLNFRWNEWNWKASWCILQFCTCRNHLMQTIKREKMCSSASHSTQEKMWRHQRCSRYQCNTLWSCRRVWGWKSNQAKSNNFFHNNTRNNIVLGFQGSQGHPLISQYPQKEKTLAHGVLLY